jgi:hypothetical protein
VKIRETKPTSAHYISMQEGVSKLLRYAKLSVNTTFKAEMLNVGVFT